MAPIWISTIYITVSNGSYQVSSWQIWDRVAISTTTTTASVSLPYTTVHSVTIVLSILHCVIKSKIKTLSCIVYNTDGGQSFTNVWLAYTISSLKWFHSAMDLTKNELQHCSVLLTVFTQSRALLMSDDCVVRFRLLLGIVYNTFSCSSCVRMFSGGIAGIRPMTILGSMVRHSYLWQSSKLGTFQTLQHLSYAASISRFVVLCGVMGSLQFFCAFQVRLPCCCSWLNLTTAVYARHLNSPRQFWRF